LAKVDASISNLELQLSDLRALRQNILRRLHEIGAEKFEDDERKVLYMVVRESPETVAELSELLDEKESVLKTVITRMKIKMQNESDLADLFEKF
jgi:ArsR family transcriptional regulator